jgi:aryl-alcohol dehydrogenase-like predicted oxidoreductase
MIETRKLGQGEVRVGAIALGAMAFAGWYDTRDDEAGVIAIHRALDAGITLIDTAEVYEGFVPVPCSGDRPSCRS